MSQVYATEPKTEGRVIFDTTHGPLEIQLWSRECPQTTRFFLQLCLDGYYNGMVFHRIVPNFLVQTGAIRSDGESSTETNPSNGFDNYRRQVQADSALDRRRYEVNSRIRFNHRGQVAMALTVTSDDAEDFPIMQPQFFITLDDANNLDGSHVIFGTIQGPTVFNALRIGRTDVDEETNQPTTMEHAPRIQSCKIVENPIHKDLLPSPSSICPWSGMSGGKKTKEDEKKKKRSKRKAVNNKNLLSFADDFDDDEENGGGMKSSHDVIQSSTLLKEADQKVELALGDETATKANDRERKEKILPSHSEKRRNSPPGKQAQQQLTVHSDSNWKTKNQPDGVAPAPDKPVEPSRQGEDSVLEVTGSKTEPDSKKQSLVEARRAKYKKGDKDKRRREEDTMAKLFAFQSKIKKSASGNNSASTPSEDSGLAARMARRQQQKQEEHRSAGAIQGVKLEDAGYHGQILDDDNDEATSSDWLKTRFKCRKHMDHDSRLGGDGRSAMDDYEVVDETTGEARSGRKRHKRGDGDYPRSHLQRGESSSHRRHNGESSKHHRHH